MQIKPSVARPLDETLALAKVLQQRLQSATAELAELNLIDTPPAMFTKR